jgi:hypothetical protein
MKTLANVNFHSLRAWDRIQNQDTHRAIERTKTPMVLLDGKEVAGGNMEEIILPMFWSRERPVRD